MTKNSRVPGTSESQVQSSFGFADESAERTKLETLEVRTMGTYHPTTELRLPPQYQNMVKEVKLEKVKETKSYILVRVTLDDIEAIQKRLDSLMESEFKSQNDRKRAVKTIAAVKEARNAVADDTVNVQAMDLVQHPIGAAVPKMSKGEISDLRRSMEEQGYLPEEPVVLYEGMILDGFHRYTVAAKLGLVPSFRDYRGDDPTGYVRSRNLDRRHLTDDQRAQVAASLSDFDMTVGEAATKVKVTASKAHRARRVAKVSDQLADAVRDGTLRLIEAEYICEFDDLVKLLEDGYDGDLRDIVPETSDFPKPETVKLILSGEGRVWQHAEVVYDEDGNALGEAYWIEPEPEPEPIDTDAVLEQLGEDIEDTTSRAEMRKAVGALDVREIAQLYDDFEGGDPGDKTKAKQVTVVVGHLMDWFAAVDADEAADGADED